MIVTKEQMEAKLRMVEVAKGPAIAFKVLEDFKNENYEIFKEIGNCKKPKKCGSCKKKANKLRELIKMEKENGE